MHLAEVEFQTGDAEAALRIATHVLEGAGSQYYQRVLGMLHHNCAAYCNALGRYDAARQHALTALPVLQETGAVVSALLDVQHLAATTILRQRGAADRDGDVRRAARVIGYVDATLRRLDISREYTEQYEYDKILPALSDALGANELAALFAEGAAYDEELAISEATAPFDDGR